MYPADWHKIYGDMTGDSARRILPELVQLFEARSSAEIGCGNAHWTQAAIDAGVEDYVVIDGPWNVREHLLVDTSKFIEADLAQPLVLDRKFDMAVCLEVAEHVQAASADVLVQSLVDLSDVIIFGAAIPLQGGFGHINEQWPSWWRAKFERHGYSAYDLIRPRHWEDQSIHYWYRQNTFVYVNRANEAGSSSATYAERERLDSKFLFDAVHPEKFEETASYRSIAVKRVARQLPRFLAKRLRAKLAGSDD